MAKVNLPFQLASATSIHLYIQLITRGDESVNNLIKRKKLVLRLRAIFINDPTHMTCLASHIYPHGEFMCIVVQRGLIKC